MGDGMLGWAGCRRSVSSPHRLFISHLARQSIQHGAHGVTICICGAPHRDHTVSTAHIEQAPPRTPRVARDAHSASGVHHSHASAIRAHDAGCCRCCVC